MRTSSTPDGILIHSAREYDRRFWLRARGREGAFRRELVRLARLAPGEDVLDVGCGTGSLALAAKRAVGPAGTVRGIDPSAEMLERARRKARRSGLELELVQGVAQRLPWPDACVDAALVVLTLHQLPHDALPQAFGELRRVLRAGGRLLLVDLDATRPVAGRTPHAHGVFDLELAVAHLAGDAFATTAAGPVAFRLSRFENLRWLLARAR